MSVVSPNLPRETWHLIIQNVFDSRIDRSRDDMNTVSVIWLMQVSKELEKIVCNYFELAKIKPFDLLMLPIRENSIAPRQSANICEIRYGMKAQWQEGFEHYQKIT